MTGKLEEAVKVLLRSLDRDHLLEVRRLLKREMARRPSEEMWAMLDGGQRAWLAAEEEERVTLAASGNGLRAAAECLRAEAEQRSRSFG